MRRALCILLVAFVAGCAGPAGNPPAAKDNTEASHDEATSDNFLFQASQCLEGGGHSVHPQLPDYLPEPWLPADVMEDTGKPPVYTEPYGHPEYIVPEDGNSMGNWHVTMKCGTSTLDGRELTNHLFGYVGMRVEPPPFDTGAPVDRHYLITVIASNDAGFREALHHRGFHATDATGDVDVQESGLFHNLLDTADHGVYEAYFMAEQAGEMPGSFRLWFQKENTDKTFSPISLDLHNQGGERARAQGYGTFTHLETQDHAPLPGAGGESPGLAYGDFSRTITFGPAPDVKLEEAYIHL